MGILVLWLYFSVALLSRADDGHFVDVNGEDGVNGDCGADRYTPCATLSRAISVVGKGETLYVLANGSDVKPYFWCRDSPLVINSSMNINGYGGRARIGCERGSQRMLMVNITGHPKQPDGNVTHNITEVVFYDIDFTDVVFHVKYAKVTFRNCILKDSKWISTPDDPHIGLHMFDSEWIGSLDNNCTVNCNPTADLQIMSQFLDLFLLRSHFYHSKLKITANKSTEFLIDKCTFSNKLDERAVHGGIYLTVGDGTKYSHLLVRNSIFEHQYHNEPVQSIINLYEAALFMRVASKAKTSNVTAFVDNCEFQNNERGLTFTGPFAWTNISNSLFTENIAMHAGAGVLYLTDPSTPSFIQNSTFDTNSAGAFRPEPVEAYQDSFEVIGDEVRIHSNCCKGIISFVGKGGAIRIQRGVLSLADCTFRNNTARLLGGAVFVDRGSAVNVENTLMENSPIYRHAMDGDLLYSNGNVSIGSARLVILTAQNHVSMVRHSGDHWSIEVVDVSIFCPVGYRLRVTNSSAYGVTSDGLRRSYKMDQLSYFCESCPRNKYSLDHGFLNFSLVYSTFAYYTLLINGEKPEAAYNGTYVYQDIECMQCPYGGRCQQGIRAVPNFWGYIEENQVRFQHCPDGYCCSNTDCKGFDVCAKYRTGTLCGECHPGYSEALFSEKCIPDEECDPTWLLPMILSFGTLYALCLFFQEDLCAFMSKDATVKISWPRRQQFHGNFTNQQGVSNQRRSSCDVTELGTPPTAPPVGTGAGLLLIVVDFFQDAQLLHVDTVFASADNKSVRMLRDTLSGIFEVELFQFMDNVCFLQGITPSVKLLIKAVLVPYILLLFGFTYLFYHWFQNIHGARASATTGNSDRKTFLSRLATGFVLALMFTYQKMATTSFSLLHCVPVGDVNVLFIQGSVGCYTVWQYGVIAYAGFCVVPFCAVLLIGPGLLKEGLISLRQFFCACIIPLPFLVYWMVLKLILRGQQPEDTNTLSSEGQTVLSILQGPFKESQSKLFGPMCGAGVLIGRRLILVLLFTFVNDTLIRMLCMMLLCFTILLHHVHVLPYKDSRENLAESASATALLIVSWINLVRAAFEAAEYEPHGPNATLMQVIGEIENTLLLWLPAAVVCIIIISVAFKLFLHVLKCLCSTATTPAEVNHVAQDNHVSTTL